MDFNRYRDELATLQANTEKLVIEENEMLHRTLCFTSANLGNYLPEIPVESHGDILKKILLNKEISLLDGKYEKILDLLHFENLTDDIRSIFTDKPSIIYSFHLGSMQLINHFFAYNKIDFVFVASKKTLDEHIGDFLEMAEYQKPTYGEIHLQFIEADESSSVIKMINALKKGKKLLIYVDGNIGAGEKKADNSNLCKINFLDKPIYVRQGAAVLSYLTGVPLTGVICYRDQKKDIRMRFIDPIYPDRNISRQPESKRLMQAVYNHFSSIVKHYPEQWECWIYLHQNINTNDFSGGQIQQSELIPEGKYKFNKEDFGLFKIKKEHYLLCKKNYQAFNLLEEAYQFLMDNLDKDIVFNQLNSKIIAHLIQKGVLLNKN